MALSSDQIATLLSQGAITAAQAQALGAQSAPMQSSQDQNASYSPPLEESSQPADHHMQSMQSVQPQATPGMTSPGNGDVPLDTTPNMSTPNQNQSVGPTPQVSSPVAAPAPSGQQLTPGGQPREMMGTNSMMQQAPSTGTTAEKITPAQLQMEAPKAVDYGAGKPIPDTDLGYGPEKSIGMLQPEKNLYETGKRLGQEGLTQLQTQKDTQLQLNQMQLVANQTAADMAQKNADALSKSQAENKAAWDAAMKKADAQSADIVARAKEIGQHKIDPNRYWNSMDNAGQFFAGLSLSLGAAGSALSHTPNYAFQRMQDAIKNDIEAQKSDIDNAYKSLGVEENSAHSDLQRAQLNAAYQDKTALEHWETAKVQANAIISKMQTPIDKQQADLTLGKIDDQIRQSKLGMASGLYNFEILQRKAMEGTSQPQAKPQTVRNWITDKKIEFMEKFGYDRQKAQDLAVQEAAQRFNIPSTGGGTDFPGKGTKEADKEVSVKIPLIKDDGSVVRDGNGNTIYTAGKAVNATAAKEITEGGALEANAKISELTQKLIDMRKEHSGLAIPFTGSTSGGTYGPETNAEAQRIVGELRAAVLKAEGLNRYTTEDDQRVVTAQVPEDPLAHTFSGIIGNDPVLTKLQSLNDAAKKRMVGLTSGGMVTPIIQKSDKTVAEDTGATQ